MFLEQYLIAKSEDLYYNGRKVVQRAASTTKKASKGKRGVKSGLKSDELILVEGAFCKKWPHEKQSANKGLNLLQLQLIIDFSGKADFTANGENSDKKTTYSYPLHSNPPPRKHPD